MPVYFILKRMWTYPDGEKVDLWEEILHGRKTSEWRDSSDYWAVRLLDRDGQQLLERDGFVPSTWNIDSFYWKHKTAIFIVGYKKYPRITADITAIKFHRLEQQFEIQFKVKSVEEKPDE